MRYLWFDLNKQSSERSKDTPKSLPIANCQFPIERTAGFPIGNLKSAIDNDLVPTRYREVVLTVTKHQTSSRF